MKIITILLNFLLILPLSLVSSQGLKQTRGNPYMIHNDPAWLELKKIHMHDLNEFFQLLDKASIYNSTSKEDLVVINEYLKFIPEKAQRRQEISKAPKRPKDEETQKRENLLQLHPAASQKRHLAAYQRALFEVTWKIPLESALTDQAKYNLIERILDDERQGYISAITRLLKEQKRRLSATFLSEFELPIPYLDKNIEADLYKNPNFNEKIDQDLYAENLTIIDNFNENTAWQLLHWIQASIDNIFNYSGTNVAMKQRLLTLVKESSKEEVSLKKLYALAFSTEGSSGQYLAKSPAIAMLYSMIHTTDWAFGRTTFFWKDRWSKEGVIQRPLNLESALQIYIKMQTLHEARQIIKVHNTSADEEFIQNIILTYLINDQYTLDNIPSIVRQKQKEEDQEEATIGSAIEHLVGWTRSCVKKIFSYA